MKFSIRDSRLVSVGVASVIAVSVIGFGSAAFAQDSGTTPTPSTQSDGTTPKDCDGHGLGIGLRGLLKNTGLTAQEIADGKAAGLTWGQILDQYGDVTAAQAKQQVLDTLKSKLDQAVANGKLTQEQADQKLADAGTKIDEFLNSTPGDHAEGKEHGRGFKSFGSLETVAGVLGIDEATLRQRLAAGETLAQIAGDKTQAVIDALTAEANAKIDEAVANGKMTQEQADQAKAKASEMITKFVNEGGPFKGIGKGFGRGPKGTGAPMTPSSTLTPAQQ
jgi:polyhydroxyalkanoate synthesis regulator phasin